MIADDKIGSRFGFAALDSAEIYPFFAFLKKSPNDTYLYLENYNSDCPEILNTYGICKWHLACNFSTSYVINFLCKQPLENPVFVN